jgi:hypothetical protein
MTKGKRIREIMEEERHHAMRQINNLPAETWEPALTVYAQIQTAVNAVVQERDGALPIGLCPAVMRIAADEMDRIGSRMADEGLLYGE